MLYTLKDDDIALLPLLMVVDVGCKVRTVFREERVKNAGPPEIDIRIGFRYHSGVCIRIIRYICVNHGFEIIPRIFKRSPHQIGACSSVGWRISAGIIAVVVCGNGLCVHSCALNDIRIIIDTVSIIIRRTPQAALLRTVLSEPCETGVLNGSDADI